MLEATAQPAELICEAECRDYVVSEAGTTSRRPGIERPRVCM